jgi:hypothetical protein
MKTLSGIMSEQSKREYLESSRARYSARNRAGKSLLIDEVSDVFGWDRKHTIKALNGRVSLGDHAKKRGSKPTYGPGETEVILAIWKLSEQPCGLRLKATLPAWLGSYQKHHGKLSVALRNRITGYSARTLERITKPHRLSGEHGRLGRKTGRTSHRLKTLIPVQCGPQEVDRPGWMEADTVSHGGGSSSGEFLWSLTLTDLHTGWTELGALWGNSGSEVRAGLENIEKRMPFALLGFDCDNGSEFLNTVLEHYLLTRDRPPKWTRSRPYKKNDQAHVEQKNFTHVRQLLGYGRYGEIELKALVDDLYGSAWLPLRNHFTPVMKLVGKIREGSRVRKNYDKPSSPYQRLLDCPEVDEKTKRDLRKKHLQLDPIELARAVEEKLAVIFKRVDRIEEERAELRAWAEEEPEEIGTGTVIAQAADLRGVVPPVAAAPSVTPPLKSRPKLANKPQKKQKQTKSWVS